MIQFFGRYIGSIRKAGFHWDRPAHRQAQGLAAGAQLRVGPAEGLRRRRQPGRDRGGRGLPGHRLGQGALRGRRPRAVRRGPGRDGGTAPRHQLPVRVARGRPAEPARQRRGQPGAHHRAARAGRARRRRGARDAGSPTSRTPPRSPRRCSPGSRPTRSWRPASRSSRVRSAWCSNALDQLREQNVVDLDEERKAQMVSNLLVVLCGDRATQPVVNTGTLY